MADTLRENLIIEAGIELTAARPRRGYVRNPILRYYARPWMGTVLLLADMLGLGTAILLAMQVGRVGFPLGSYYQEIFLLLAFTLAILFQRRGLYPAIGTHYVHELRDLVSGTSFAFLIIIGVTFVLKTSSIYSRLTILGVWALCLGLIPAARYLARRLLIGCHWWGEPVAIIGQPRNGLDLSEYFMHNLQLGLRPVVVFRGEYESEGEPGQGPALTLPRLHEIARERSIKTALVVINDLNNLDLFVERYRAVFERVIFIKGSNGSYSLNSLKSLDLSGVLGLQVMNNLLSFWAQLFKRLEDVVGSVIGLAFLAPFFAFVAVLIKLTGGGGSVYYRQKVVGRDGRTFEMLKFRTMYPNAARLLEEIFERDPEARREWDTYQKIRNDPRITPAGKVLRKFSFDELPQLWNVLHGEMSLVGPRPMMLAQREPYGEAFKDYIQVSPGMTGLWQVSGRNETTFARRAELDREYIQRWSAWLDVFILLKTAKIVFWHRGAY